MNLKCGKYVESRNKSVKNYTNVFVTNVTRHGWMYSAFTIYKNKLKSGKFEIKKNAFLEKCLFFNLTVLYK